MSERDERETALAEAFRAAFMRGAKEGEPPEEIPWEELSPGSRAKWVDATRAWLRETGMALTDREEIDSLRAQVGSLECEVEIARVESMKWDTERHDLGAELARLRAPVDPTERGSEQDDATEYRPWESMGITELAYWKRRYIEARMSEASALREALERISAISPESHPYGAGAIEAAQRIARRALEGTKEEG